MKIGFILIINTIFCLNAFGQGITKEEFAEKLNKSGICTGKNIDLLNKSIADKTVKREINFIRYCDKGLVIDLDEYSDDPKTYIEQIHKKTGSLLTGLNFKDFQYEIKLDEVSSSGDYKSYDLYVEFNINGKHYAHKSFISPDYLNKYDGFMKYFGKIGSQEYYGIFNKVLVDVNSPYRLHLVESVINNAAYYTDFEIIALMKEQAKMLHSGGIYFSPSYEDFKNTVTSQTLEKAKTRYKQLGLLSHLSEGQINRSFEKINQNRNSNINFVLQEIPDLTWYFDVELWNLENPYEEILLGLNTILKGQLIFSKIEDGFDVSKSAFDLKYSLNENDYEVSLKVSNDWLDGFFFEHLEDIISEQELNSKLHFLYTGGQDISLIFLTDEQAKALRIERLALFADQWKEIEDN